MIALQTRSTDAPRATLTVVADPTTPAIDRKAKVPKRSSSNKRGYN